MSRRILLADRCSRGHQIQEVLPAMSTDDKTMVRNRPTAQGLARLTDIAEREVRKEFPGHSERCGTCAFRLGTIPNGCETTLMDALKATIEGHPFLCHEGVPTRDLCSGWAMAITSAFPDGLRGLLAPWEYST